MDDFRKYATKHLGMNSLVLDDVIKSQAGYLNPYILEERQLNVTQLDVFSRLMMDRIIFIGTQIDDYTANTLQAAVSGFCGSGQGHLYLYQFAGRFGICRIGYLRHHAVHQQRRCYHLHWYGCQYGCSTVGGRG